MPRQEVALAYGQQRIELAFRSSRVVTLIIADVESSQIMYSGVVQIKHDC